jgi:hypothetical protein
MTGQLKKTMAWAVGAGLMLAAVDGTAGIPGISLKLDGGLARFRVGDTNTNITELERNWQNVVRARNLPFDGSFEELNSGMEAGAEIRVGLMPCLAVSMGLGRLSVEKNGNRMEMALPPPIRHQIQAQDNQISSMPVTVNLYYLKPFLASGTFFARVGAGYYITKWREKGRYDEETSEKAPWWREWELDAKANGLGVQGGIGLEYRLVGRLSITLEGYGRYCRISGFKGDGAVQRSYNPTSSSYPDGTLYYYEWKDAFTSDWYGDVNLRTDTPGGENERNVRKAEVDLSGIGVKAGLIVRLW